ncbi:MAG: MerR family transcriptional regulator [Desulfovibrio sp.]|nr:MAG: MerR family transcriptional regulator [Desulfovibrio sp.]
MTPEFYSLREIGRKLNIPPSSVVYYKDRFERFIPHAGGGGRKRYPAQAVPIFKEIRTMFDKNWSAEQIEESLARQFHAALNDIAHDSPEGGANQAGPDFVADLTGMLDKMSGLLENQTAFRAEIDTLRQEVSVLKQEKKELEARHTATIINLEAQLADLKNERSNILEHILQRLDMDPNELASPPAEFLALPLVIKNENQEYLGVAGKTRHFSLCEFVDIIRENGAGLSSLEMAWSQAGEGWTLRITATKDGHDISHSHELEVAPTLTPSGNRVVQLTRLVIDGNTVPDPFLLVLFRKIKDGFDD